MAIERVAVTGGNGKIGEAILGEFGACGYHTVNLSRGPRDGELATEYRRTDLLDAGEVYGTLARSDADAVVHMGTIPGPTTSPAHVCYESNVMTSWNVLESATELGLEAVVLPSSINAMGAAYQEAPVEVEYLPVDETHPLTPRDPYALAKEATERAGAGYGRRPETPKIASLRYPWVGTESEIREEFTERDRTLSGIDDAWSHTTRPVLFSYLHIEDAARIARRAVETDFEGYETFWAVAGDTTVAARSDEVAQQYYPDARRTRALEARESLISIRKAGEVLDWEPTHTWTDL